MFTLNAHDFKSIQLKHFFKHNFISFILYLLSNTKFSLFCVLKLSVYAKLEKIFSLLFDFLGKKVKRSVWHKWSKYTLSKGFFKGFIKCFFYIKIVVIACVKKPYTFLNRCWISSSLCWVQNCRDGLVFPPPPLS